MSVLLPSCGTSGTTGKNPGNHPGGTGPFDKNGNYVEAWADNPSKWGRRGPSNPVRDTVPDEAPAVARNEQPPDNAVPLVSGNSAPSVGSASARQPTRGREVEVANLNRKRTVDRDEEPSSRPKAKTTSETAKNTKTKSKASESTATTKSKSGSSKTVAKKTPTKGKATTKPPSRYVVKKGDSLSSIASRNKTSVTALQKANGIKGSVIQPGKSLVIPRY